MQRSLLSLFRPNRARNAEFSVNNVICDGCWQWGDGPHACVVSFIPYGDFQMTCKCQVEPECGSYKAAFPVLAAVPNESVVDAPLDASVG